MTNEIRQFFHNKFGGLDVIMIGGKPYFPAKDCAKLLGYKDAVNAIKRHCRGALKRHLGVQTGVRSDGAPAYQTVLKNYIPESDLYRLLVRSRLPAAKRFESWVCDEVLPSIRKHGAYFTPETLDKVPDDPESFQELLRKLDGVRRTPSGGTAMEALPQILTAGMELEED